MNTRTQVGNFRMFRNRAACAPLGAIVAILVFSTPAAGQPEKTLVNCQKTAAKETVKLTATFAKTVGKCLDKIAKETIQNGGTVADASPSCASALRKLINSEDSTKTIFAKFAAKVSPACDPTDPETKALHSAAAVSDPNAPNGLQAGSLGDYCGAVSGFPVMINDPTDWMDCLANTAICESLQGVAMEYPRALEWLNAVGPLILANDPNEPKYFDAAFAAAVVTAMIDGNSDGSPDLACGPRCGDGVKQPQEDCDGSDDAQCSGSCTARCTCFPNSPVQEDLTPCASVIDTWAFSIATGEQVHVAADTVAGATASDLIATVNCTTGNFGFGDDDVACTFPPPAFSCPSFTFVASGNGSCTVTVDSLSTCANAAISAYKLTVTRDGSAAFLTQTGDDIP